MSILRNQIRSLIAASGEISVARCSREQVIAEYETWKAKGRKAIPSELSEEEVARMLELGSRVKRARHLKALARREVVKDLPRPHAPNPPPPVLNVRSDGFLTFNQVIGVRDTPSKMARKRSRLLWPRMTGTRRVVVDCSYFADPYTDFVKKHLVSREISRCIKNNREHPFPAHLFVSDTGQLAPHMHNVRRITNDPMLDWDGVWSGVDVDGVEGSVEDHFEHPDIVMLSAEAEQELSELDEDKVYVLGATVSNRSLSLRKAERLGLASARFPFRLQPGIANAAATVLLSQSLGILLDVFHHQDWDRAVFDNVGKFEARKQRHYEREAEEAVIPSAMASQC